MWGRLSAFGLAIAAITAIADQALKFWLLYDFELAESRLGRGDALCRWC